MKISSQNDQTLEITENAFLKRIISNVDQCKCNLGISRDFGRKC